MVVWVKERVNRQVLTNSTSSFITAGIVTFVFVDDVLERNDAYVYLTPENSVPKGLNIIFWGSKSVALFLMIKIADLN